MRIEIRARHIPLTETLRTHCERRVRFALDRLSDRVKEVVLRLEDTNGPRGGVDKLCSIKVVLTGLPSVVVEQKHASLQAALDAALRRTEAAVRRSVKRRTTRARQAR